MIGNAWGAVDDIPSHVRQRAGGLILNSVKIDAFRTLLVREQTPFISQVEVIVAHDPWLL